MQNASYGRQQNGFSLAELAIVLVIVGLLIGGMLMPLSAQEDLRRATETQRTLSDARDALLGFAAANGRLPCPSWDGTGADNVNTFGQESPNPVDAKGRCNHFQDGFLPAATLSLAPVDSQGFLLDAWGRRIRYAVSDVIDTIGDVRVFTAPDGQRGYYQHWGKLPDPDLRVCSSSTGITAPPDCAPVATLSQNAVVVIYSLGKNGATGGNGADESQNFNPNSAIAADRLFVSHEPTDTGSTNGEFDDIVIWLSPNILDNRMIAAGRLP